MEEAISLCKTSAELSFTHLPPSHLPTGPLLTEVLRELGELVNVLASVFAAGDAEPKFKVKALQQLIPKVMPLDHPEVIDRLITYCELNPARERVWTERQNET